MTWTPISGTLPQYQKSDGTLASGYYLKFYQAGTTTAFSMATDSTGGTTLAKCQINASGYPINGSSDPFIPHVNQDYKIVLYKNSTDADANTTANAEWVIPSIKQLQTARSDIYDDFSGSPTRTNNYTFTLTGDQTSTFPVGLRLKLTDASTIYAVITSSSFSSVTTIEVLATANLTGSLSSVAYEVSTQNDAAKEVKLESRTYVVNDNRSITNILDIPDGALISINSGITLTLSDIIKAGVYHVFSGSGTVTGLTNFDIYPEWWGITLGSDNYSSIQKAFNIMNGRANLEVPLESTASSGRVLFGPFAYRSDTTLLVYDRTTIKGQGDRCTYLDGALISSGSVLKTNRFGSGTVNQFIDIRDLTVYGDSSGGVIHGIQFAVFGGQIDGVQVKNCAGGIVIGDTGNSNTLVECEITRCKIHECTNGIHGASAGKATDIRISNNTINACSNAGILSEGSGGWHVWGNNIYNCDYLIRYVNTVASNKTFGNYMGEAEKTALYLNMGSGSGSGAQSITGNVFKTANNSGTASTDGDKALIAIVNNGTATDAEGISITGNVIRDTTGNATSGIYLSGLFSRTVIGPNSYDLAGGSAKSITFPTTKTGISVCEPQLDLYATQKTPSTVTISSGNIAISANTHYVDTESAAASDDLFTISGDVFAGMTLKLMAADSARSVVVKDSTLKLNGDFTMDNAEDFIVLHYDGTTWREVSRSDNGA